MVRDSFFDVVKCLLIICVIFGHALELGDGAAENTLGHFVYCFTMPLFVFISGYFTKAHKSSKDLFKRNFKLIETIIVFQLIFITIDILFGKPFEKTMLYVPSWGLWYLFSLFCWRALVVFINPQRINAYICVLISLTLCLLCGYVDLTLEFSFQRTFYFFPFFMIGHCLALNKIDIKTYCLSLKKSILILSCTLLVCIMICVIKETSILGLLLGSYNYSPQTPLASFTGHEGLIIVRFIILLGSFLIGFSFLSLCKYIKANNKILSIGRNTLFFYIYHLFIFAILKKANIPTSLTFILLYTIITIVCLYQLRSNKVLIKLLNPITSHFK